MADGFRCHPAALLQRPLEIPLHVAHGRAAVEIRRTLEVVIQAPVIQIDGTNHRLYVIAGEDLGVDKARRILVQLHSRRRQVLIVRFCQRIGGLLVRNARQDQLHIHSTLGSEFQGRLHLVVQNEIGRHDMHVVLGPVENVHIDALPHLIIVQWTVAVGHHIALRLHRRRGQQGLVPAGLLLRQVPHL